MHIDAATPSFQAVRLETFEPDALHTLIKDVRLDIHVLRGKSFRISRERALLGRSVLDVASCNTPVLARGCVSELSFGFILSGRGPGNMLGQPVLPGSVRVLAERIEQEYRTAPEVTVSVFQVAREEVERAAIARLGRPLPIPRAGWLNFPPTPAGPVLEQKIRSTLRTASQPPEGLWPSKVGVLHEDLLRGYIDAVASGLQLDARGRQTTSPRRAALLRQARDYLYSILDEPFSLRELSDATRCSERTLQYVFHEVYGMGPQAWFQSMKLNQANRELRAYGPQDIRVSDVALRWGFTHFGRFSVDYRRMFGESPSETLRRAAQGGSPKERALLDRYRAAQVGEQYLNRYA